MKRLLIAVTAAGALAVATVSAPQKAEAHAWWVVPSIVLGTLAVGGAIVAGAQARAQAAGPYGYQPHGYYQPRAQGTVHVAPARGCYMQAQPALWGGTRYVEVCR